MWALAVVAALSAASWVASQRLSVDTNLVALLPPSFPSVQSLDEVKRRYGAVGNVAVIARDAAPEVLERFADEVAPKFAALDSVDYVEHRRPDRFFKDRGLYFLELDDLEIAKERIEDRLNYERRKANPLLVDLADEGPPALDFSDLEAKYGRGGLVEQSSDSDHYISESLRMLVVFVKPKGMASDFAVARRVVDDVEGVLGALDLSRYPGLKVELSGRFKKRIDQQRAVQSDLRLSSLVALLLVVFYVVFHFRGVRAILLIVVPLAVGLLWTFGVAAMTFEVLNILTAFVGAILLGLGIDHGIHFLERFESERAEGGHLEDAIEATFAQTGHAVVLAGLTTAVGFAGLAISEFRAFREFGIVAAIGVLAVIASYVLCLPPFLRLTATLTKPRKRRVGAWFEGYGNFVVRNRKVVFGLATLVTVAVAAQLFSVRFDYDFASLEDSGRLRSYQLDKKVNEVLGRQQTPVVLLTDRVADELPLVARIRENQAQRGSASTVDRVLALSELIPPNQEEKRELLRELAEDLEGVDPDKVAEADRARLKRLGAMLAFEPFDRDSLPVQVQRQFRVKSGGDGGMVLVFPTIRLSDGEGIVRLANELRNLPLEDGRTVSAAGEAMVLADVLQMIFTESPRVMVATLALVLLALWLLLGRLSYALLCFAPALTTVLMMVGGLELLGLRLNYLNIVLIPVMFGIAVDAGVHLVLRGAASHGALVLAVRDTGRAIWGASITTAMGFGALLLADHPGLDSFGKTALIGLGAGLGAALVWLTSLLALRNHSSA